MNAEYEKIKAKAAAWCAAAERCMADVRAKLDATTLDEDQKQAVIDYLQAGGYLDEARYARAFVHDKFRFAGWGRIKIRYALRMKRVDENAVSEALGTLDEEEYLERVKTLLAAKKRSLSGDARAIRAKLLRFAASRGFETEVIYQALG
ncbi:MAG: RecX family transcriptional regulator [Paludibacteraceae bacterium]|nr:RecX family transcriptional regulator [Paludibacteraceae bacterium]